jgi:hypothetical protein
VLSKAGYRSAEVDRVEGFEKEALNTQKELTGRKAGTPIEAYKLLEQTPLDQTAYLLAESSNSGALGKIRAYLHKWRPVRIGLPVVANELQALGMPRGAKFDEIIEQIFAVQLNGRGKTPEEREKILRKLSGIKEPPKKKEKEKKPAKSAEKAPAESAGKASPKTAGHKAALAKHAAKAPAPSPGKGTAKKAAGRK